MGHGEPADTAVYFTSERCELMQSACLYVCLSVNTSSRLHISKTSCPNHAKFSVFIMSIVVVAHSFSDGNAMCYILPVLWTKSWHFHIMGHAACMRWQNRPVRRAASIKFPTYSSGGATLFDFVVVYSGSKLRTGGEVCCPQLRCYCLRFFQLLVWAAVGGDDQSGRDWHWWLDAEGHHCACLAVRHGSNDSVHRSQGPLPAAHTSQTHALTQLAGGGSRNAVDWTVAYSGFHFGVYKF